MPLLALVVVWIAGRISVTFSAETGWLAAMLVDAGFLALVAAAAAREILAGRNWRNLNVVMLVLLLLAGNVAFHLEAHFRGAAETGSPDRHCRRRAADLADRGPHHPEVHPQLAGARKSRPTAGAVRPVRCGRRVVLALALFLCWIVAANSELAGAALAFTGVLHLVRLGRWAGDRTGRERLLLILHVGYVFVPLGFLLNAASAYGLVAAGAGVHALDGRRRRYHDAGRDRTASLGHTGQRLTASVTTQLIYAAIIVGAITRICAAINPAHGGSLLQVAAFARAAAFLGFAVSFGRLLTAEKVNPGQGFQLSSSIVGALGQ